MIKIMPIGGYNEFGRNMTAVKIDDSVILLDMGLDVEKYVSLSGDDTKIKISKNMLISGGIIPDDSVIFDWRKDVKAIVIGHGHLDHVGAVPFLEKYYNAPILCTAYTAEILKTIARDDGHHLRNRIEVQNSNSVYRISKDLKIEFIHMTHSIPHAVTVAIHSKYGTVVYANDFKLDNFPTMGSKPNYKRLKEIGAKGVLALIADGTGASENQKTPSENIAKEMLRDILFSEGINYRTIIITTFSSHIARLNTIMEFAYKANRKVVFLGRSMHKYIEAAENVGLVKFSRHAELIRYKEQIKKFLRTVMREKSHEKYIIVCTGHQGEPDSVLGRIAFGEFDFNIGSSDAIIFSCRVIPTGTNIKNREDMERQLSLFKPIVYKDVHVSGHASADDLRVLIDILKPVHLIPAHGDKKMTRDMIELAKVIGYVENKTIHSLSNGKVLIIDDK